MLAFGLAIGHRVSQPQARHRLSCPGRRVAVARRVWLASAEGGTDEPVVASPRVPTEADTELIKATLEGNVRVVESLLTESGAAPTAVDESGRSPLHFAAGMGIPSTCELLVECGAELDLADITGYTPLHMAAGYLRPSTVQKLIDLGANPDVRAPNGQTALELASVLLQNEPEKKLFRKNERHSKLKEVVEVLTAVTAAAPLDQKTE